MIERALQMTEKLIYAKLWSYFVAHFADSRGAFYAGEIAGPWLNNIPAMSLQERGPFRFMELQCTNLPFSVQHYMRLS